MSSNWLLNANIFNTWSYQIPIIQSFFLKGSFLLFVFWLWVTNSIAFSIPLFNLFNYESCEWLCMLFFCVAKTQK